MQLRAGAEARSAAGDARARLTSDRRLAEQRCARLEADVRAKDRLLAAAEAKARKAGSKSEAELRAAKGERDEARRALEGLQRRDAQHQNEVRRREREAERLRAKLAALLDDKGERAAEKVRRAQLSPAGQREIAEAAAALDAAAAAFEAIDEPEAAAKLKAHVRDVTSKFQAAEAELKTAIVTQQIAEAVCLAKAAWEAHVAEWGVEEQGPPHILVNACYSSHTDDDQALRTEAYRPFHRIGEKVSLKIVKLIVTNNGFIANAVEKEVQSVLKADPRADNTFQRDDGGYRKGAGMGPVWGTFWETEFLKPYMMLGLNEKEALRMVYMIKYTLPGQGVALGMAKKTTTN